MRDNSGILAKKAKFSVFLIDLPSCFFLIECQLNQVLEVHIVAARFLSHLRYSNWMMDNGKFCKSCAICSPINKLYSFKEYSYRNYLGDMSPGPRTEQIQKARLRWKVCNENRLDFRGKRNPLGCF